MLSSSELANASQCIELVTASPGFSPLQGEFAGGAVFMRCV
jgi:hypothetical protein